MGSSFKQRKFINGFMALFALAGLMLLFNNCGQSFEPLGKTDRNSSTGNPTLPPQVEPTPIEEEEPTLLDPCENSLFCDDFETATTGIAPAGDWSVSTRNQLSVAVDTTRAFSGTKSVKISTTTGTQSDLGMIVLGENSALTTSGNSFYARAMIYIDQVPPGTVHWDIVKASGDVTGQPFQSEYAFGGQLNKRYIAVYNTMPYNEYLSDCYQHANDANSEQDRMVENKWACFEWRFDGPTNRAQMWVNGLQASNMDIIDRSEGCLGQASGGRWIAPIFSKLEIGWFQAQASNQPHNMWVDDVVVSESPIGCPKVP